MRGEPNQKIYKIMKLPFIKKKPNKTKSQKSSVQDLNKTLSPTLQGGEKSTPEC